MTNTYKTHWQTTTNLEPFQIFKKDIHEVEKQLIKKIQETILTEKYDSWLDLGCGTGIIAEQLRHHIQPCTYRGIDISEAALKAFNEKQKIASQHDLIQADIDTYNPVQRYDLITSFNSWYGARPPTIQTYMEALNKDGTFIILLNDTRSRENITTTEDINEYLTKNEIPHTHYTFSTNPSLSHHSKQYLTQVGFASDHNLDHLLYEIEQND